MTLADLKDELRTPQSKVSEHPVDENDLEDGLEIEVEGTVNSEMLLVQHEQAFSNRMSEESSKSQSIQKDIDILLESPAKENENDCNIVNGIQD